MRPLVVGDEIRVIAPSQSWEKSREAKYLRAVDRMKKCGFEVTFGKNIRRVYRFGTARATDRLEDLHSAYADKNVKLIWCVTGGWSANELLDKIDWDLVGDNPKPLLGYSDITVLVNAIYAKTGQTGLLGPNLGSVGLRSNYKYTLENLLSVLATKTPLQLFRSKEWQGRKDVSRPTRPWKVLNEGTAKGIAIGGNLGTFYLLQGTQYEPSFDKAIILVVEDDDEAGRQSAYEFDRRLESILQLKGARENIKGVLIGRFQPSSGVSMVDVQDIVSRKIPKGVPVFADIDFGHTKPLLTLPIGGTIKMYSIGKQAKLELVEY